MTAPTWPTATPIEEDRGRYLLDRQGVLGPLLLLPAVLYIFALVGIPLVLAITYSVSDVTVGDQSIDWAGLDNFRAVWNDDLFQKALRHSIAFTIISQVIVIKVLANILVLVLSAEFPGGGWCASSSCSPGRLARPGRDRLALDARQCL